MTHPKPVCCPPFDPVPWDDKTFIWKNKNFVKARIFCLFYFPINFTSIIKRLVSKITTHTKLDTDFMCLSDYTSPFGMDIYVATDKPIPTLENIPFSGNFYAKVYDGAYTQTAAWCRDFNVQSSKKHLTIDKGYMWYTMCPKCAKLYGKNYVVILGKIIKDK